MRTILLVLTVLLVGFVAVNRQQIYLRDPLGTMTRDGVKVAGTRVFLNYSNDVLVQVGNAGPGGTVEEFLAQGWNGVVGVPERLTCLAGMACLAEADHAPMVPVAGAGKAVVGSRKTTFVEGGVKVRVALR